MNIPKFLHEHEFKNVKNTLIIFLTKLLSSKNKLKTKFGEHSQLPAYKFRNYR